MGELAKGDVDDEMLVRRPVPRASGHNDVFTGRNAGLLRRRCGGSLGFWRSCSRLPNVLVFFLKYLTIARPFVVGSLLVSGPSSRK